MSALGQKQTWHFEIVMSALPPKADIAELEEHVRFVPKADIDGGRGGIGPAKTGVLPVWACGLGRTLLAVEVRNAYWRQFHAMRVQAFNTTVFPRDSTAKPLHIRTAISSQGDLCLRIHGRWGPFGSRSPRYRGGSSNGWRRRRWQLQKDFHVGGLQPGDLVRHLVLSAGKLLHGLPQQR